MCKYSTHVQVCVKCERNDFEFSANRDIAHIFVKFNYIIKVCKVDRMSSSVLLLFILALPSVPLLYDIFMCNPD